MVAQGAPLHQTTLPPSTSLGNMSSASNDIAPGTPKRSPTPHPPSPQHKSSQAAADDGMIVSRVGPPFTHSKNSVQSAPGAPAAIDMTVSRNEESMHQQSIQPATHQSGGVDGLNTVYQPTESSQSCENLPLLAVSTGNLLSDKLTDPGQLLSHNSTLQTQQHEAAQAEAIGLSEAAVRTGFKAAGRVSTAEGMSEPVTEAIEAMGPVHSSPQDLTEGQKDERGRIMQVWLVALVPSVSSVVVIWQHRL